MLCFFITDDVMRDDAAFDVGIVSYTNPKYGFGETVNMQVFGNAC